MNKEERISSYYNTNKLFGSELAKAILKAEAQEKRIKILFKHNAELTPFDVCKMLGEAYPITSIRRGITNLTSSGYLQKLEKMKVEVYGAKNHYWKKA